MEKLRPTRCYSSIVNDQNSAFPLSQLVSTEVKFHANNYVKYALKIIIHSYF